jgi:DNA-binding transcriptional MerR regulator
MRINEAAEATGLSADTIRFYEKQGIVPPIHRDQSGHRTFSRENIDWMIVLFWLRKTGMPMDVMSRYAALVHAGDDTIPERKVVLREHGKRLAARRSELDRCDELLAYKLAVYDAVEKGINDENE